MKTTEKNLDYYRKNAEEDYLTTPISVLRYISEMEAALRQPLVSGELADFVQFLADEYSIKVPERVIDEWEKYYSANYR